MTDRGEGRGRGKRADGQCVPSAILPGPPSAGWLKEAGWRVSAIHLLLPPGWLRK